MEGKRSLCKMIHIHPENATTWRYLVQYMLTYESDLTESVSRCCQIGLEMDIKHHYKVNLSDLRYSCFNLQDISRFCIRQFQFDP